MKHIPSDAHVWLAVQIGNRYWVKEPEILQKDQQWSVEITEGSSNERPGREYSLDLFLVDTAGHRAIGEWLKGCTKTGDCPGMEKISGSACFLSIVPVKMVPAGVKLNRQKAR